MSLMTDPHYNREIPKGASPNAAMRRIAYLQERGLITLSEAILLYAKYGASYDTAVRIAGEPLFSAQETLVNQLFPSVTGRVLPVRRPTPAKKTGRQLVREFFQQQAGKGGHVVSSATGHNMAARLLSRATCSMRVANQMAAVTALVMDPDAP